MDGRRVRIMFARLDMQRRGWRRWYGDGDDAVSIYIGTTYFADSADNGSRISGNRFISAAIVRRKLVVKVMAGMAYDLVDAELLQIVRLAWREKLLNQRSCHLLHRWIWISNQSFNNTKDRMTIGFQSKASFMDLSDFITVMDISALQVTHQMFLDALAGQGSDLLFPTTTGFWM